MVTRKLPRHVHGIHFAEVGEQYFVTAEREDVVALVNKAGFALLSNLDGRTHPHQVAARLARGCDRRIDEDYLAAACDEMCKRLEEIGLVELVDLPEDLDPDKERILSLDPGYIDPSPEVVRTWRGEELAGSLLVHAADGDIRVIVPNVTEGPITTCPSNTCTVPAGLFGKSTLVRVFDQAFRKSFRSLECRGGTYR